MAFVEANRPELPTGWQFRQLSELADVVDSLHQTPEYAVSGFPMVRVTDVKPGFLSLSNALCVTEEVFAAFTRNASPRTGDIVFSRVGSYGLSSFVSCDKPFCLGQNTALIRPKVNARFIYSALQSPLVHQQIEDAVVGSTQKTISLKSIRQLEIAIPENGELKAIASVLGALDDKIELNRRMNETLEAMARALFQSWFVDATQAGLPKGWRESTLGELASIHGWKQLPTEECQPRGPHTVFGANGIMGYAERATHENFVIAFGRVGAYCGSIHWAYRGAWINNNASAVVPHRWPEFVLQAMLDFDFGTMRTGSAQPFIPNSALAGARVLLPSSSVAEKFCEIVHPLRLKQTENEEESRTLAALRDALLPKLLSGELRITT